MSLYKESLDKVKERFGKLSEEQQSLLVNDMAIYWASGESINYIYYKIVNDWDIAEDLYQYGQRLSMLRRGLINEGDMDI